MQQEGYSLPVHPDGHLVRKTHFMVLKFAVTTATSACCKDPEWPGGSERKLAEALWIQSGGKTRTQPNTHLVGSSWGLGKHLCWGKGTRAGNVQWKKNHTHTHRYPHTAFQTQQGTAGSRNRHEHGSPDPSSRPRDTEEQQWLIPAASPQRNCLAGQGTASCKNHIFLTLSTHFRGLFCLHWFTYFKKWERTKTTKSSAKQ